MDTMEEAVEQLFCAATLTAQGEIRDVVYDAAREVTLKHIRTSMLGELIKKHVDHYLEAGKAALALGERLAAQRAFHALIASFVQMQTIYKITK